MDNKTPIEIFYRENSDSNVEVRLSDDTVWLSQRDISELFEKDRTTINRHINNIFKDEELDEKMVQLRVNLRLIWSNTIIWI
ncbi:MAG: hypothetical protein JXR64_14030 [Spirochaetales bacterium]|nr:hypothetical protein [Spirochaetales bacterium]